MAKLPFRGKKMTGMAPPAIPAPQMGRMGGFPIASRPAVPPARPMMPMPKPKRMPVMKQKGTALSKFAPPMGKVPKRMAKKVPKRGALPF